MSYIPFLKHNLSTEKDYEIDWISWLMFDLYEAMKKIRIFFAGFNINN